MDYVNEVRLTCLNEDGLKVSARASRGGLQKQVTYTLGIDPHVRMSGESLKRLAELMPEIMSGASVEPGDGRTVMFRQGTHFVEASPDFESMRRQGRIAWFWRSPNRPMKADCNETNQPTAVSGEGNVEN